MLRFPPWTVWLQFSANCQHSAFYAWASTCLIRPSLRTTPGERDEVWVFCEWQAGSTWGPSVPERSLGHKTSVLNGVRLHSGVVSRTVPDRRRSARARAARHGRHRRRRGAAGRKGRCRMAESPGSGGGRARASGRCDAGDSVAAQAAVAFLAVSTSTCLHSIRNPCTSGLARRRGLGLVEAKSHAMRGA